MCQHRLGDVEPDNVAALPAAFPPDAFGESNGGGATPAADIDDRLARQGISRLQDEISHWRQNDVPDHLSFDPALAADSIPIGDFIGLIGYRHLGFSSIACLSGDIPSALHQSPFFAS